MSTVHSGSGKSSADKGAIPKATIGKRSENVRDVSHRDNAEVQDCYFFQNETFTKLSLCPYLHRVLPRNICKQFLFKNCRRPEWCEEQHVAYSALPPPSEREIARAKKVNHGHACMLRKKEEKRLGESTGAINKARIVPTSPEKSSFQCLDCGISTTSCFLLETHLNTEEHWERVKQVQLKGRELRGVVGGGKVKLKLISAEAKAWG